MGQVFYPDFQDTVPVHPVQLLDIGHPRVPRNVSSYGLLLLGSCVAAATFVVLCLFTAARWALA